MRKFTLVTWAIIVMVTVSALTGCGGGSGAGGSSTPTTSPTPTGQQAGAWTVNVQPPNPTISKFAGTYSGLTSGMQSSDLTVVVCSNGQILMNTRDTDGDNRSYGISDNLDADGNFSGTVYTGENDQLIQGTFSGNVSDTTMTGNWTMLSDSGTFSCNLKTSDSNVAGFNGNYLGNITGDTTGSQAIAVGNEGKLISLAQITLPARNGKQATTTYAACITTINPDGSITGSLDAIGYTGTFTGNINGTGGAGAWNLTPAPTSSPAPSPMVETAPRSRRVHDFHK